MSSTLRLVSEKTCVPVRKAKHGRISLLLKRTIDIIGAGLALLILWPVLLSAAIVIWLTMGRPILFRQYRSGYLCSIFTITKFRTMKYEHKNDGNLLPDKDRLTVLGKWLRKTSIDELPQLWQVFKGDMSLVGPRPLFPSYLPRYTASQRRRHEMKPGITGWAQINGRNAVSWEQRFALDVWYVDNWTICLDLQILIKTGWAVLRCHDVTHPNHATMPEFLGSDHSKKTFVASA